MNKKAAPDSPELAALKRAALEARKIALQTGTPLWVMEGNKIVDVTKPK